MFIFISDVCIYDTFSEYLDNIKHIFKTYLKAKYLKRSFWLCPEENFSVNYFSKDDLVKRCHQSSQIFRLFLSSVIFIILGLIQNGIHICVSFLNTYTLLIVNSIQIFFKSHNSSIILFVLNLICPFSMH